MDAQLTSVAEVTESALANKLMDRERECVSHAKHGTESIRARAKVGDLTEKLHGVPLLLQGIVHRIRAAVDMDLRCLELDGLSLGR